jgi:hypothetical protein
MKKKEEYHGYINWGDVEWLRFILSLELCFVVSHDWVVFD